MAVKGAVESPVCPVTKRFLLHPGKCSTAFALSEVVLCELCTTNVTVCRLESLVLRLVFALMAICSSGLSCVLWITYTLLGTPASDFQVKSLPLSCQDQGAAD
jgi:hypothetical protein